MKEREITAYEDTFPQLVEMLKQATVANAQGVYRRVTAGIVRP